MNHNFKVRVNAVGGYKEVMKHCWCSAMYDKVGCVLSSLGCLLLRPLVFSEMRR